MKIVDDQGHPVASTSFVYQYHPFSNRDSFDQVNAYYHLERARAGFRSRLGVRRLPWFDGSGAVTAMVNATFCGAYYSSDLEGDGVPGFVFGNQGACERGNEDYARDADVIYHEYSHAIVDWKGLGLAVAPIDSYQRAVSEADADYHSASFTGDPLIGEVAGVNRDLDNVKMYPDDVPCDDGFAEEHCTSEIWSGLLWDLRSVMKEGGERLEFASLDYLMDHWPEGQVETWIDFWDATMALMRADQDRDAGAHAGLIYGAAASRGIFGPAAYGGDNVTLVYERLRSRTKFKSVGWVHNPSRKVRFYFTAPVGRQVAIKVRTKSDLRPTFLLGEGNREPIEYFASPSTLTPTEASLETVLPPTPELYVLDVYGLDSSTGSFQLSIAVR